MTINMYSEDGSESQVFEDKWCLWDSGANISFVLSSSLKPEVKSPGAPEEGYV
jgi:hypothetical protein